MKKPIQNNLVLELHVPDFGIVKQFYSKLGFEVISEDPVAKNPGYLVMRRKDPLGETILNFYGGDEKVYQHQHFKKFPLETPRGYATEITIPVSDIENLYKSVVETVPKNIVRELKEVIENTTNSEVRWRDFRMVDPFGFYIRLTELIDWGQ